MEESFFISTDGKTKVVYYIYNENITTPRAVLQISHGMQEHVTRYEPFAKFLNDNGIIVCGNDHLGHGKTSKGTGNDGYFAKKHGADYVLNDLHKMTLIIKEKYPNIPVFLMGHSMGSFFARLYASKFPNEIDGLIACGTSGKVKGATLGLLILDILKLFKGGKSTSDLAENIMCKSYFKYIPNKTSKFDWITSNEEELKKYLSNERCSIRFTVGAYHDMVKTLKRVNTNSWAKKINKDMPILLISGAQDPVGQYGKGVCQVYSLLEKQKVKHIDLRLYSNARHEPFNEKEPTRHEFYNDVLSFILNNLIIPPLSRGGGSQELTDGEVF